MTKQEEIREGIATIIKKWYAPVGSHPAEGYGESCEQEIMVYLHNNDVVRKIKSPDMTPAPLRVAVEPLIEVVNEVPTESFV